MAVTFPFIGPYVLPAGTAALAPLRFQSGTLLSSPVAGAVEFLTDAFYGTITTGAARKTFAFLESPSFTTPAIGAATGASLALNGATLGSYTQAMVGSLGIFGATTTGPDVEVSMTGDTNARVAIGLNTTDVPRLSFGPGNAVRDLFLERAAAANLRLGSIAVDTAPVAQTLSVQNVLAGGTSNVAGANFTIAGSQGKGTGVGGSIIFQVAPAGASSTVVNALATALTIDSTKLATFVGDVSTPHVLSTGNTSLTLNSAGSLTIGNLTSGNAVTVNCNTNGVFTIVGPVVTSAPSGGTAGQWKLGIRVAAVSALDTTQYLQADIGGTAYKLALIS